MPKIKYVEHDDKTHEVEVPIGWSVMEGAVKNLIPGIDAECGGSCACATCQVLIDPEWESKIAPPEEMETAMLEFGTEQAGNARLSCQMRVEAGMDGLVVRIPKSQR
jgi:ferredoxin, 2Fe-2S